jgi:hypothetical protein
MNQDIESEIRSALRPVAPSDEFSQRLLARVASHPPARPRSYGRVPLRSRHAAWWVTAGLAASLVLTVGVERQLERQRSLQSGLEARREVLQALRVTSQKLNLASEAVKSQSSSLAGAEPAV